MPRQKGQNLIERLTITVFRDVLAQEGRPSKMMGAAEERG
jgi:hypothetical protein